MKLSFIGSIYFLLTIDINSLINSKVHGDLTNVLSMDNFCPESRFECKNGECIPNKHICDGRRNCSDSSHQTKRACFSLIHMNTYNATSCDNDFQCSKGICLNRRYVCDSHKDCENGNDETPESCATHICEKHEFRCTYGGCIDKEYVCDSSEDCIDGSDEIPEDCAENSQNFESTTAEITTTETTTAKITIVGNGTSDAAIKKSTKKFADCDRFSKVNNGKNPLRSQYFYILSCLFIIYNLNKNFN